MVISQDYSENPPFLVKRTVHENDEEKYITVYCFILVSLKFLMI